MEKPYVIQCPGSNRCLCNCHVARLELLEGSLYKLAFDSSATRFRNNVKTNESRSLLSEFLHVGVHYADRLLLELRDEPPLRVEARIPLLLQKHLFRRDGSPVFTVLAGFTQYADPDRLIYPFHKTSYL